uniref:Uncharacterized protein n=1 Tax=viral metagenome TaxID=1070528 RepID=A0A6H1ZSI3_9ZZZZ
MVKTIIGTRKKVINNKTIIVESGNMDKLGLYVTISKNATTKEVTTCLDVVNINRHKSEDSIDTLQDYIFQIIETFQKLQYELDMEVKGLK